METQHEGHEALDGASGGQGDDTETTGDEGFVSKSEYNRLESQLANMNDRFDELREALVQQRSAAYQQQPAQVEEDFDDDEPLTAGKVSKIVQRETKKATSEAERTSQRREWDRRALEEFPTKDPEFERQFRRVWREQVESGLDGRHPKALYNVAKIVAKDFKKKDPKPRAPGGETTEAPSTGMTSTPRGGKRSKISDSDERVAFYNMKGDRSPEQIARFKERLERNDARKDRR